MSKHYTNLDMNIVFTNIEKIPSLLPYVKILKVK